jgi:Holliday junction resolvase RusA-like endonuclease
MKFLVQIDDLPPKKHSEKSMWSSDFEAERLIKLRKKVCEKLTDYKPLSKEIYLKLTVYIPENNKQKGDLDNFITGICDGLMRAHRNSKINKKFDGEHDIDPRTVSFINDDSQVVQIIARKVVNPRIKPHYELEISEKEL